MNKSFVKQLIDIVLLLKDEVGGGMHPGGGSVQPPSKPPTHPTTPGMHPGGGGHASREKRQYDPKGPHEGPRKGHYYKPGEREVGGVQVEMVQAPKAKKPGSDDPLDAAIKRINEHESQQREQRNSPPPIVRRRKAGKLGSTDLKKHQLDVSMMLDPSSLSEGDRRRTRAGMLVDDQGKKLERTTNAPSLVRDALKKLWKDEGSLLFASRLDEKGYPMLAVNISTNDLVEAGEVKDQNTLDSFLDKIAELTSGEYQGKYAGRHLFKPLTKKQQEDFGYMGYNPDLYSFSFRGRELNENKDLMDDQDQSNNVGGNRFRITIDKNDLVKKRAPKSIEINIGFAPRDRGTKEIQRLEWEFDGVPHEEASKRELAANINSGLSPESMQGRMKERLKQLTDRAMKAGGDWGVDWYEGEDGRLEQR